MEKNMENNTMWKRVWSPEKYPYLQDQLIFYKVPKQFKEGKNNEVTSMKKK